MRINLSDIDLSFMKSITKDMAEDMSIISIKSEGDKIYFYTDKETERKRSYLSLLFDKKIEFIKGDKDKILYLINKCYSIDSSKNIKEDNFYVLIEEAIKSRASDIHIEPKSQWTNIRFRIDGILNLRNKIQKNEYEILVNKIKVKGNMDISDKLKAQDGKISFCTKENFNYDLRISSLPTVYGEKIVIRILYKREDLLSIHKLNFTSYQKEKIKRILSMKNGMVIINGPTGSGKSTTLYALLNSMDKDGINISTIEDPVEFQLDGVTQTNVNEKVNLTFSNGLKYILRQDPDVILIGEIRDEETAKIAVRASITGHKVYSTIHANNGSNIFSRLLDIGVEKYLLDEALKGVITQRLVRTLCENCKEKVYIDSNKYSFLKGETIFKAKGCKVCGYTGVKGRTMVSKITINDKRLGENLKNNENELLESCRNLLLQGKISLEEYILFKESEMLNEEVFS
ncbi:MAG: GspE/PulE family protein [Clostridium perfringens]|nr:GspE/PulE family protein [Clostridium perfringens]